MFTEFTPRRIHANGIGIHTLVGGSGPPLLLLHGYPQSHLIWHRTAPELAKHFTVIVTDLRGYGLSGKPTDTADHANYSKREMAKDQVEVMRVLGFDSFHLCGHDRGGRVAHRLAVDHPQAVKKLMLLDISPTLSMYEQTSMDFARAYWWWFWLIQPSPFPENMVAAAPEIFLKKKIGWGHAGLTPFTDETYAAYLSYVSDPAIMHAMCEDDAGGALAAWEEHASGALPKIRVQRVNASGALAAGWPAVETSAAKQNPWAEIRAKIFKTYARKSIGAGRATLMQANLSIERNPGAVNSMPSFPSIFRSP